MKYLKLYEAFKSKGISNTIKFIKNKIGASASINFIESLRSFMYEVNYPVDKLSDDYIKYLSASKALQLKNDKTVTNPKGIWVIKYWFSLEKGFLGFSGTGNEEVQVEIGSLVDFREAEPFSSSDLETIEERITRTGEIWPVTNYKKLKTGDTVIGKFDSQIAIAKIFVDRVDADRTYVIQSVVSGSDIQGDSSWRNYTDYGSRTWWIYSPGDEIGNDHRNLHFWRQSDEALHYIESPDTDSEKEEKEQKSNPLEWNLPLSNRFSFSRWGRGSSISKESISEADFALVLYYDDLLNPEKDAENLLVSDTRNLRKQQKERATALMSEDEIRRTNIENYIQKLTTSLNITETEFYNLEKIVSKHLCGEFSFISIYLQRPDWTDISDFIDYLYQIVDEPEKEYYLNRVKELYTRKTKSFYEQSLVYQKSKSIIKLHKNDYLTKTFDEIYRIGSKINNHFSKYELNSIDNLYLTKYEIKSLYEFIKMSRNRLSYETREIMNATRSQESTLKSYLSSYGSQDYGQQQHNYDMERLKNIEDFLSKLTKKA